MIIIENKKNEIFCKKCETYSNITFFLKNYRILKNCESCRLNMKLNKQQYNCQHNKMKYRCVDCSPWNFCVHQKRRDICPSCFGSQICSHGRQSHTCRLCQNNDEVHIIVKQMLSSAKQKDIKYNRYNKDNFIDYNFVKNLIQNCDDKCFYCKVDLQYLFFNQTLATIERLNPKIGHIKSNVKIACHSCNISRVGQKINLI
jgi:hypothetical protein